MFKFNSININPNSFNINSLVDHSTKPVCHNSVYNRTTTSIKNIIFTRTSICYIAVL